MCDVLSRFRFYVGRDVLDQFFVKYTRSPKARSLKLLPKRQGPFTIRQIARDGVTAVLDRGDGSSSSIRRHFSTLVPITGDLDLIGHDGDWEVEKIVDERVYDGVREFLVRWRNYPPEMDRWVPETDVQAAEAIAAYRASVAADAVRRIYVFEVFDVRGANEDEEFLVATAEGVGPRDYVWLSRSRVANPDILDTFVRSGGGVEGSTA